MIHTITSWIYAKLEYLSGAGAGLSVMVLDIPQFLIKILVAIILGGSGAFGSHLVKISIDKISNYMKKRKGSKKKC